VPNVFGHVMLVDGLSTLYQLQRRLQGSGHTLFVGKFKHLIEGKVKLHLSMCLTDVSRTVFVQGDTDCIGVLSSQC